MKYVIILCSMIFLVHLSRAQVDMTNYIGDDLFKVEANVNKTYTTTKEETEGELFYKENIQKGIEYWKNGELDEAIDYFNQQATFYEEIPHFYYFLGALNYEKRNYEEAIQNCVKTLSLDPLFLDAKYILGLAQVMKGEKKKGKSIMLELSKTPDYQASGFHGLAIIASQEQNYYRTVQMYEKCIKADSSYQEAYLPLAYLYTAYLGQIRRANRLLDRAVALDFTWQEARITRAIFAAYEDKNLNQFRADISVLLQQDPKNYHYHAIQGYLSQELKDYANAVASFREAMNLEVGKSKVAYKFKSKLTRNKSLKAIVNYYFENKTALQSTTQAHIDQGICSFISKKYEHALNQFDSALTVESHSLIYCLKALVLEMRWTVDQDAIFDLYKHAIEEDSLNHIAYLNRGNLLFSKEHYQAALHDFNKLVSIQPKSVIGYKNRGILLLRTSNYVHAYRDFSTAIALTKDDSDLFFNRGTAAFYAKYYTNAVTDFKEVINAYSEDEDAYYMIAQCNLQLKDTSNYIIHLDSASKFGKYEKKYHLELLNIAKQQELEETILAAQNRLVRYFPYYEEYILDRAKHYLKKEDYQKAKSDLVRLIKRKKKHAEAHHLLGECLLKLGDQKKGEHELEKAKKLGYSKS